MRLAILLYVNPFIIMSLVIGTINYISQYLMAIIITQ
jgi:hypothetical protein